MSIKIFIRLFLLLCISILFIYIFPFILVLKKKDDYQYNILREVNKNITSHCKTDLERANAIFNFTCKTFVTPSFSGKTVSNSGYNLLITDSLWCDEQCTVLTTLAEFSFLKGRIIFLNGKYKISRHSVCELNIDHQYRMYDPFYQLKSTKSVEELTSKNNYSNLYYRQLFTQEFPHRYGSIKHTKYLNNEHIIHTMFNAWLDYFGHYALKPYLLLTYKINKVHVKDQIKINRWLFQHSF